MIRSIVLLSAGVCWAASVPVNAAELRVGAAVVEITPEAGKPHYRGKSGGVHDPLHAKALTLSQGDEQAALVACDLINVAVDLTDPARRLAAEKTGIPRSNIVIFATHTHTGPRGHNDLTPGDEFGYAARVRDAIVRAIVDAQAAARPATLQATVALQEPTVSFNRRFHMRDGSVRMNPGFQNPGIVRPEGPIDPEVRFLLVRDSERNRPLASLTNFALHLDTVGGDKYSADYPYYIESALQSEFGKDFVSLFGTGCCGDVNHYDVTRPGPQRGHVDGYQTTKHIGEALAATIERRLSTLEDAGKPALAVRRAVVQAPIQSYSEAEIAWAQAERATPLVEERPFLQRMRKRKLLSLARLRERYGDRVPLEVQVIRLTDKLALVFLPGEVFVELGKAIKTTSPFEHTFVIELANNSIAYVPTRLGFKHGDYEAVNSRVAPGSGERMAQAAVRMLVELSNERR